MVRLLFIALQLSDEDCEHFVLGRMSTQRFCQLIGVQQITDGRTLWSFKQRFARGGLDGLAIFDTVSLQLHQHGYAAAGTCSSA